MEQNEPDTSQQQYHQQVPQQREDYHPNNQQASNPEHHYSPRDDGKQDDEHDDVRGDRRRQGSVDSYENGGVNKGSDDGKGKQIQRDGSPYGDRKMSQVGNDPVQIYVGGIGHNVDQRDIRDLYQQYGQIADVVMKGRYAFVEFEMHKDAETAIHETHGLTLNGYKLIVEQPRTKVGDRGDRPRRAGPSQNDQCWKCHQLGHWASDCRNGPPRGERGGGYRRGRSNSRSRSPPRRNGPPGGGGRGRDRSDSRGRGDDGRSKELREGLCFICKERGHLKRDCPDLNRSGGGGGGGGGGDRRGRGGYDHRRRPDSRSRSPAYRDRDYGRRREYSPPARRRDAPSPRRSPPRRRDYSRDRSPPTQQRGYDRRSKSPDARGGPYHGSYNY